MFKITVKKKEKEKNSVKNNEQIDSKDQIPTPPPQQTLEQNDGVFKYGFKIVG